MGNRLSRRFLRQYSGKTPNWGPVGEVVYLRTYSRWLEDKGRRETWDETVARAVNYSASLGPTTRRERERLFDLIWNLKMFPAGRTLWIGDTPLSREHPEANMNCSFEDLDDAKAFHDMVLLLMSGSGVGFRVTDDVIGALNKNIGLPAVAPMVSIKPYAFAGYNSSLYTEHTAVSTTDGARHIIVGDSREGWAEAVMEFLAGVASGEDIVIDVNSVRPHGERLKRFGGYASGPKPLMEFFERAALVLFDKNRRRGWVDTKALDLANLIARMVVSGGTRRSALIALGNSDEFASAKIGTWGSDDDVADWIAAGAIPEGIIPPWRSQSNNSVLFFDTPSFDGIRELLIRTLDYGEPGIMNGAAASRRREHFRGGNPCLEILLDNHGFCNLSTVNLSAFVDSSGKFLFNAAAEALRLLTRHTMRITNVNIGGSLSEWDEVQKRDRLIGVSLTGIMDAVEKSGMPFSDWVRSGIFDGLRRVVHNESAKYAAEMGIDEPLLKTTIKPEGTLSLLPGVSSGIHNAYAPYYIRRIRISNSDAVGRALIESGVPNEPDNFAPDTTVFSFAVKSPASTSASDVSAIEMLDRYLATMKHWTDHNTSITVQLGYDEVDEVAKWLLDNWDSVVGVSFIRRGDGSYQQQPYEKITESEYKAMAPNPTINIDKLTAIERGVGVMLAVDDIEADCDSGHCPVR